MRWLDREQLPEVGGLGELKCVVSEWYYVVLYSFGYFEPMECFEHRTDVVVFGGFSKSINVVIVILIWKFLERRSKAKRSLFTSAATNKMGCPKAKGSF